MRLMPMIAAGAICLFLAGCGSESAAGGDAAAAVAEIEEQERQMVEDLRSHDAAKVAAHYAADAAIIFPGGAPIQGAEAIARSFTDMLADPAFAFESARGRTAVAASGDLAYARGTYRATYTDPGARQPISQSGNYLTVYRKQQDGRWKVIEDITSPGLPDAAAVAAAP